MGHAYKYRCTRCGFEESFNEGHGFLVHSQPLGQYLNQSKKLFHYKTHQALKKLAISGDALYLKSGFQIYSCPKCKTLYDKKEVVIYNDETAVYRSEFRCSSCRTRLKLTNIHRLKKAVCPKCGKSTFQKEQPNTFFQD